MIKIKEMAQTFMICLLFIGISMIFGTGLAMICGYMINETFIIAAVIVWISVSFSVAVV